MTFACLAEPALFLGLLVLAKLAWSPGGEHGEHLRLAVLLGNPLLGERWTVAGASLALVVLELVHRAPGRELPHSLR